MTSKRWRATLVGLAVGLVVPLCAVATPAAAGNPGQVRAEAVAKKADKRVIDRLAKDGQATFWVYLGDKADLSAAAKVSGKANKAAYVYKVKTEHANRTQAGLRQLLAKRGAHFTPFWLANTIEVTGDAALVGEIAARPEVSEIVADQPIDLPAPQAGTTETTVNGVEWNVDRINAPRVWNELGVRGEGIVVANIDTGVDYTHPALAASYRGRSADGTYNHNYNWFDPAHACPSAAPCDNAGHGTHTMGTMVGLDGTNAVGVAPGAKWIAAKGCESDSCSQASLLAAGQWIVAPTDLNGANPRPDLAPDVVNNSWGANVYDPWYRETVAAWVAAGIFPAFSNGNNGPSCNTAGNPGSYSNSYSSGAFDVNNAIASFSARGTGENGDIKPNIAAPGVNIRSSVPNGGYASLNGTSMASPHTAATVALMWSASPLLHGDIAATRAILDDTAIDVDSTYCGGTADDNNVFGEGRLDAYAAVSASPRGAFGALGGRVTSAGAGLADATVTVAGPLSRTTTTAADGSYSFGRLVVGDYTVTISKFGYLTGTATATITESQTTVRDIAVELAPTATISGTVTTAGGPAAGASINVLNTPISTGVADGQGHYSVTVPQGEYDLRVNAADPCSAGVTRHVAATADTTLDINLPDRVDTFGYACNVGSGGYVPGTELVAGLTGDNVTRPITLPFSVPLYGKAYRSGWVSTNGVLSFGGLSTVSWSNTSLPSAAIPNFALYPFWDDLYVEADSGVYTAVVGAMPHRSFIVEWRNVSFSLNRSRASKLHRGDQRGRHDHLSLPGHRRHRRGDRQRRHHRPGERDRHRRVPVLVQHLGGRHRHGHRVPHHQDRRGVGCRHRRQRRTAGGRRHGDRAGRRPDGHRDHRHGRHIPAPTPHRRRHAEYREGALRDRHGRATDRRRSGRDPVGRTAYRTGQHEDHRHDHHRRAEPDPYPSDRPDEHRRPRYRFHGHRDQRCRPGDRHRLADAVRGDRHAGQRRPAHHRRGDRHDRAARRLDLPGHGADHHGERSQPGSARPGHPGGAELHVGDRRGRAGHARRCRGSDVGDRPGVRRRWLRLSGQLQRGVRQEGDHGHERPDPVRHPTAGNVRVPRRRAC